MIAISLAVLLSAPLPAAPVEKGQHVVVDPGIVQHVEIMELNVGLSKGDRALCRSAVVDARKKQLCPTIGRRYALTHEQRARVMAIVNGRATYSGRPASVCPGPRHAFVFETTKGLVAIDVNLECHTVAGPKKGGPTPSVEQELVDLFRSFGLIFHLPKAE